MTSSQANISMSVLPGVRLIRDGVLVSGFGDANHAERGHHNRCHVGSRFQRFRDAVRHQLGIAHTET